MGIKPFYTHLNPAGLGYAGGGYGCQKGEFPFPALLLLVLPFSPLSQLNSAPDHQIWGYLVCVGFVFSLCGLWQHRMSGGRAGLLETGWMFDMGIFFLCWSRKSSNFFLPTHVGVSLSPRQEGACEAVSQTQQGGMKHLGDSSRGRVMLTHTKLGS